MRRIHPEIFRLILIGSVICLVFLGGGAGVASFLLLRAGYSFLVWGLLPALTLILVALFLGATLLLTTGSALQGEKRKGQREDLQREDAIGGGQDPHKRNGV